MGVGRRLLSDGLVKDGPTSRTQAGCLRQRVVTSTLWCKMMKQINVSERLFI